MTVRLLHLSDSHGVLYPLRIPPRTDAIVHSGDIFPTFKMASDRPRLERGLQEQWIAANAERLVRWTQGLPFLYCTGNHDYTDGESALRDAGIDAHCLNGHIAEFAGLSFYGFPWTKFFTGTWNDELRAPEMGLRVAGILAVDVLVSHGPIAGILDRNSYGEGCGDPTILTSFLYDDDVPVPRRAYLHGHIHESHGVRTWQGITVSNAATTQHILEIETQ